MTGREIYNAVKVCCYLTIEKKIYKNKSWLHKDNEIIGFIANTNAFNWEKYLLLNKIKYWCEDRKLPIEIINDEKSPTRFKIKIIKHDTTNK